MKPATIIKLCYAGLFIGGILALVPLGNGILELLKAKQAESWPTVSATVTKSEAITTCTKFCLHIPELEYQYFVDGTLYTGARIFFGERNTKSKRAAARVLESFPVGRRINVHVDPANAAQATVYAGKVGPRTWIGSIASLAVYLVAVIAFFVGRVLIRQTVEPHKQL